MVVLVPIDMVEPIVLLEDRNLLTTNLFKSTHK